MSADFSPAAVAFQHLRLAAKGAITGGAYATDLEVRCHLLSIGCMALAIEEGDNAGLSILLTQLERYATMVPANPKHEVAATLNRVLDCARTYRDRLSANLVDSLITAGRLKGFGIQ